MNERIRALLVVAVLAACNPQSSPSTAVDVSPPPAGLTGHVTVAGGPHGGDYELLADAASTECNVAPDRWAVAFASQVLTPSVTTLQLAGTGRDTGAPVADFFMTIGETRDSNTVRISPSQYGGSGTAVLRLVDDAAHVEMTGTSADGATVNLRLSCTPVDLRT